MWSLLCTVARTIRGGLRFAVTFIRRLVTLFRLFVTLLSVLALPFRYPVTAFGLALLVLLVIAAANVPLPPG